MKEGWKYKKLGDCCEVLNGFAFKSDKYVGAGTRVIRITNVQKGYIVDDDPKYYPDDEMSHLGQYCLYENDLLMSLTGNVGRVGLLQKEMLPAALNQRVACLRIKGKDISLRYLFHCLNSVVFEQKAIYSATGIAQKNMSTEWLKKYEIPVPSLPEQERIVAELDCLSDIIEKQKQQLKELDNLAQSIFYTTFGDPISNNFGWNIKRLGEVCTVNPSKKDTSRHLVCSDIISFLPMEDLPIKACYYSPSQQRLLSEVQSSYTCFAENDILLAKVTPCFENGKVGIATELQNGVGYGSSEFIVLRPNLSDVIKEYIYYVVQDPTFKERACAQFTGTSGLRRVPRTFVENCAVSMPPLSLQQEFASKIEAIEKQKDMIKQSIAETETLFNSRMDYYFN